MGQCLSPCISARFMERGVLDTDVSRGEGIWLRVV
jgi:hypothetical protein